MLCAFNQYDDARYVPLNPYHVIVPLFNEICFLLCYCLLHKVYWNTLYRDIKLWGSWIKDN